jgi:hypothetical protein
VVEALNLELEHHASFEVMQARKALLKDLLGMSRPKSDESGPVTYLGIQTSQPPESLVKQLKLTAGVGLLVDWIEPGTPAEAAALRQHDLLEKLDDQLLVNGEQLTVLVRSHAPGDRVKLSLVREGKPLEVEATLAKREPEKQAEPAEPKGDQPRLGVEASESLSDETFLRRVYLDLLGVRPTPAEMKAFVDDKQSDKRERVIDKLLAEPEVASRISGKMAARWTDDVHSLTLTTRSDGQRHLRAVTTQGHVLFDGPIETDEQQQQLPEPLRTKMRAMLGRLAAEQESAAAADTPQPASAEAQLAQIVGSLEIRDTPLREAVAQLGKQTGTNLVLNAKALQQVGVDLDEKITLSLHDVRLSTALKTLLALASGKDVPLGYRAEDEVILISPTAAPRQQR